ncbi:exopolysaccharide biosynthesis protein [Roseivivax sp. CAU 1761]
MTDQTRDDDGPAEPASLCEILSRVAPRDGDSTVSIAEVLDRVGRRSFPVALLVVALILITPLSGIPGAPTVGGAILILISGQALLHRDHLWLPGILTRRKVKADRLRQGLDWLDKPAAWVDRHSRNRWRVLTRRPFSSVALLLIIATAVTWPVLELLPFFTSAGAIAVALLAIGLMVHDGIYVIAGYVWVTGVLAVAVFLARGIL